MSEPVELLVKRCERWLVLEEEMKEVQCACDCHEGLSSSVVACDSAALSIRCRPLHPVTKVAGQL